MTRPSCHGPAFLFMVLTFSTLLKEVATFLIIKYGKAQDTKIRSENYPDRYPMDANVTWTWDVPSGYWGVVFLDFDFDLGLDGYGDGDRLEIDDRYRTPAFYTASNKPVVPYRSQGSQLHVRFVTDPHEGENEFKGFDLQILYGNTEAELERKISLAEAAKLKKRPKTDSEDEKSTPVHVTTAVTLIVIFTIAIIAVVIYSRRKLFRRQMRRQSTMSVRTGRAEMLAATARVPTTPSTPRSPITPFPRSPSVPASPVSPTPSAVSALVGSGDRRPSQAVQRSNSQRDWSARAELSLGVQTRERSAQPNDYSTTEPTHQTNIKYTISHEGGGNDISVSSTITSNCCSVPDASRGRPAGTTNMPQARDHRSVSESETCPPRRLQKSQSEKVMTTVGATSRDKVMRGKASCSLSKLSTIFDDSQEFGGAGDFVDTIDHLDPLPLQAIRGKNFLPPNLRGAQSDNDPNHQNQAFSSNQDHHFDLNSTSPPPYFTQTSSESNGCYENISTTQIQMTTQRKPSIYTNQISLESAGSQQERPGQNGCSESAFLPVGSGESSAQNQLSSLTAAELAGDYAYLKQPDESSYDNNVQKQGADDSIDMEDIFGDALDKVVPVASKPNTTRRLQRLSSAYDIPPKGDDPYDIPPTSDTPRKGNDSFTNPPPPDTLRKGDDPYDIPPSFVPPRRGHDPYGASPASDALRRGDDPYDIPPSCDSPRMGSEPLDIVPASGTPRRGDDPYDIPPTSDSPRRGGDPYNIPPAYGGLHHVMPARNLDYVPNVMVEMQTKGDYPYDIPPSSGKM